MPIYYTTDYKLIVGYDKDPINKFRPIISKLLIDKFGKSSLNTEQIIASLFFTMDWYAKELLKILNKENDLCFFQSIFLLHEISCDCHRANPNKSPISQLSDQDFSLYRRVLKLCLEQACDIPLKNNIPFSKEYLKSKEKTLENILYLGDFIYTLSNIMAQMHLVEDSIDLKFTDDNQFYFDHKHHYGYIIESIVTSNSTHLEKAVFGKSDFDDFFEATKECLDVDYDKAVATIMLIHKELENQGGKFQLNEWFVFPKNLENIYNIPYAAGEVFYKGLTLSKENKLPILEAVYKPQSIQRYLYRPFLIWNVNGTDFTIVGDGIFQESIVSLCTNAFGWNKYPIEWENECFKAYINRKVKENDKILEDVAEKIIRENKIVFDRNITHFKKWNNKNIDIDNSECGEIDFLFLYQNKIFIADCKHNIARYDMNNYKNDYAAFDTNKKAYNKTLAKKILFLESNINAIKEHFQVILNDTDYKIDTSIVEGIFIVNTPTFIMYNNKFRIYTLKSFEELLTGEFVDQSFQIIIEEEDSVKMIKVEYPYFKKPNYFLFDIENDE